MPHFADYYRDVPHSLYNRPPRIIDALSGRLAAEHDPDAPARTKVAIVGAGYGKEHAPTRDDTWEVWALNAVPVIDHVGRLRADRWFELHERSAQSDKDMVWIKACPFPIYLPPKWCEAVLAARAAGRSGEDVPNAIAYPLAEIERQFGSYFTCTFAYQIALALHEGFDTIGLYGVELAYGTQRERTVEWACVSYWLGLARGMGVSVLLPPGTKLGTHQYRYGIEYASEKAHVEKYLALMARGDEQRALLYEGSDAGMGG